jgi:hypothetical protein
MGLFLLLGESLRGVAHPAIILKFVKILMNGFAVYDFNRNLRTKQVVI